MHRALAAFIALLAAYVAEAHLLARIVSHPAGPQAKEGALLSLLWWSALPLVAAVVVVVLHYRRAGSVPWAMVGVVCVFGPLLGLVALLQYSHATPGFIVVAFVVQCAAVLRSSLRLRQGAT